MAGAGQGLTRLRCPRQPALCREAVWGLWAAGGEKGGVEPGPCATFDGLQDDAGVVVGDDVGVAVLGLVHLQVGVLPCELLARVNGLRGKGRRGGHRGCRGALGAWEDGRRGPAHLVLLGELEAVVGLEAFRVLRHVRDGDGRVAEHACGRADPAVQAGHWGPAQSPGGTGVLYGVSLRWVSRG